jgi:hypothetical protein
LPWTLQGRDEGLKGIGMLVIEEPVIIRSWGDSERLDYVLPPGTHTLCELQDILNDQAGYEAWEITDDGVLKGPFPRKPA